MNVLPAISLGTAAFGTGLGVVGSVLRNLTAPIGSRDTQTYKIHQGRTPNNLNNNSVTTRDPVSKIATESVHHTPNQQEYKHNNKETKPVAVKSRVPSTQSMYTQRQQVQHNKYATRGLHYRSQVQFHKGLPTIQISNNVVTP